MNTFEVAVRIHNIAGVDRFLSKAVRGYGQRLRHQHVLSEIHKLNAKGCLQILSVAETG